MQKIHKHETKVALVTGAARRIGAAIATTLHAAGMNVVLHYHTSEREAHELCERLNDIRPSSACVLGADLSDLSHLNHFMEKAVAAWERLDLLVNNASRFYRTPIGEITTQNWDDLLKSNVAAPLFLSQAAAPFLAEQHGSIVNIADVHGMRPMRDYSVYCVTKAALLMVTQSLAKELGPSTRVNAVAPGMMMRPEGENALSHDELKTVHARTILHREGEAEDVAKAVLYLSQADFVTGQVLAVDGGRSLHI